MIVKILLGNGKKRNIKIDMTGEDIKTFIKIACLFDKSVKKLKTEFVKIKGPPHRTVQKIVEKV